LPNRPGTVRRALNRRAALSRHPKTPEFRGKTARPRLVAAPAFTRKAPLQSPEKPTPHASPHKKVE